MTGRATAMLTSISRLLTFDWFCLSNSSHRIKQTSHLNDTISGALASRPEVTAYAPPLTLPRLGAINENCRIARLAPNLRAFFLSGFNPIELLMSQFRQFLLYDCRFGTVWSKLHQELSSCRQTSCS